MTAKDVTTKPIEVSAKEKLALDLLCCGARGFLNENTIEFGMTDPDILLETIVSGSREMKDTYMVDPDDMKPMEQTMFREQFDAQVADMLIENAGNQLTGELADYYWAQISWDDSDAGKDANLNPIIQGSFCAVSYED